MYSYMNPVSRVYQTNPYMNQNARQHSQEAQPKAEKPQENVLHQDALRHIIIQQLLLVFMEKIKRI